MKKLNITNLKFGRLTALEEFGFHQSPSRKQILWKCICDCGQFKIVRLNSLTSGLTNSCGCLRKEGNNKKHGMASTIEYNTWLNIKNRCLNKNNPNYYLYGGRGITISKEWKNSFEVFFKDMGKRPKNTSIDRIDNSKGYSKDNCRWATNFIQSRNKRSNSFYKFNGLEMCLTDWANHLNIHVSSLHERLQKWPFEKALTTFKEIKN